MPETAGAIVVLSCPEYRVYKKAVGWITAETAKTDENEHRIRNTTTFTSDKTLLQTTSVVYFTSATKEQISLKYLLL